MKLLKTALVLIFVAFLAQSCQKQAEATYMENYVTAKAFTPDWTDNFSNMDRWKRLPNDGEVQKLGNDPNATWTKTAVGLHVLATGGWNHRIIRINDTVNGDFEAEFKARIDSANYKYPQAGIFVGNTGNGAPKMFLVLDNYKGGSLLSLFVPGLGWWNNGKIPAGFDVHQWQVIKVVKEGNKLSVYINGQLVHEVTDDLVLKIQGYFGLSVGGSVADFEYVSFNGAKDTFKTLDAWGPKAAPASTWTTNGNGLQVYAHKGWNHRAILADTVPKKFTVEFKVKLQNPNSGFPEAGIFIGELGNDPPKMVLALDNYGGGSAIVQYIQGRPHKEWIDYGPPDFDVNQWQTIRLKKDSDNIYVYVGGTRISFEKGSYITNIQGHLGIWVEGCNADFEFISFKKD
ncbi:MAG: hypothetical protein GXO85_00065 [Chlorobi bacterium]|nr:hypothetical protein [Chlorobiota bacterium]